MKDLIEALQIFLKYGNPYSPTHCEHDVMLVMIDPDDVSLEDQEKLDELGFGPDSESYYGGNLFYSYRFGSA